MNKTLPIEQQVDYPFLRLSYEYSVKLQEFKKSRRLIEKEMARIMKQLVDIQQQQGLTQEQAQLYIDDQINQLKQLKQRINDDYGELDECFSIVKKRIVQQQNGKDVNQLRLNRQIMDYLVRQGYFKSAYRLIKQYGMEVCSFKCYLIWQQDFSEMEYRLIEECYHILQNLKEHQTDLALEWCLANKSRLQKIESKFEFYLLFQNYIELLRVNDMNGALSLMRRIISMYGPGFPYFKEIEKGMGCLLLKQSIDKFPEYLYYFDGERWDDLIRLFKKELYNTYSLPMEPQLLITMKCGLSSLKSIFCQMDEHRRRSVCPVCSDSVQRMSRGLPTTQKSESRWICRITGEIMDENNPPMMLPNHQVYSRNALQSMSDKLEGKVVCPVSKKEYQIQEATRVYLS